MAERMLAIPARELPEVTCPTSQTVAVSVLAAGVACVLIGAGTAEIVLRWIEGRRR